MTISQAKKPRKRRQYIVDWKFQSDLMVRVGLFSTLVLVVLGAGLLLPLFNDLDAVTPVFTDAAGLVLYLHAHLWPLGILCLGLAMLQALNISHRVAGPLVRVKRALRQMARGEVPRRIRLRDRDFMGAEVDAMNEMFRGLSTIIGDIKEADAGLRRAIESCEAVPGQGDVMTAAVMHVRQTAEHLREKIQVLHEEGEVEVAERSEPQKSVEEVGSLLESELADKSELADTGATQDPPPPPASGRDV